jgi:hypothetical protein
MPEDERRPFVLYVSAIIPPGRDREAGLVKFTFEVDGLESLEIDLPYLPDAETIDASVKHAARNLVILAEALVAEAKRLAA